jgi:hypothetical protein
VEKRCTERVNTCDARNAPRAERDTRIQVATGRPDSGILRWLRARHGQVTWLLVITFAVVAANIVLSSSGAHPSGPPGVILILLLCCPVLLLPPVRLRVKSGVVHIHQGTRKAHVREGRRSCMLRFLPEVGAFG